MLQCWYKTMRKKARGDAGISSLEMLFAGMALLILLLAIFIVGAAYWNATVLQSAAQNASLTAQFIENANSSGHTLINPDTAVNNVINNSTTDLMLVPVNNGGAGCAWYTAGQDTSGQ